MGGDSFHHAVSQGEGRRLRILVSPEWKGYWGVPLVFLALGGLVAGIGWAVGEPPATMAVVFAIAGGIAPACMVLVWLSILAHEMAHAVAARIVGLRILQIDVGSVQFVLRGETAPISGTGGVHVEETLRGDQRIPATFISLAGPLADLAVIGLAAVGFQRASAPWSFLLFVLGLASARNAYLSLVPSASGDADSDIKQVLDYWKPRSQIFAYRSLYRVWPILAGADPTRFEAEDVRRATWLEDPEYAISTFQISAYYALGNRLETARSATEAYVEACAAAREAAEDDARREHCRYFEQDALFGGRLRRPSAGARSRESRRVSEAARLDRSLSLAYRPPGLRDRGLGAWRRDAGPEPDRSRPERARPGGDGQAGPDVGHRPPLPQSRGSGPKSNEFA